MEEQDLSKAGRLTLLKSLLSSIPVYYMSLFLVPKGVASQMERLFRKFYWNEEENTRKMRTVSWDIICTGKEDGLGVKKIQTIAQ